MENINKEMVLERVNATKTDLLGTNQQDFSNLKHIAVSG